MAHVVVAEPALRPSPRLADDYSWSSAAQDLYDGKAAMLFHGDWAKGYLVHLGWIPGVDFGVSGPPGASDLFIYGADMFFLPSTAPHFDKAKAFMGTVASPEGQVAFNLMKGSTPMRTDVRAQLDKPGQSNLDDLIDAKVLMPGFGWPMEWEMSVADFVENRDRDAMLKVWLEVPPT